MFKLVCGAGNEDCESVKRLVYTYAKAGCRFFDLSARKEILESAKNALKLAEVDDAMLCVSVGIKGDPHLQRLTLMTQNVLSVEIVLEIVLMMRFIHLLLLMKKGVLVVEIV